LVGLKDLHDEIRPGRPPLDDLDAKILATFDKSLFESAYSIAEKLIIAYQAVVVHLHGSIGFESFYWHWVPHLLTDNLCEKCKEHARIILHFLHEAERNNCHHLVTGDESWFSLNIPPYRK
jgi:hypothetical protein